MPNIILKQAAIDDATVLYEMQLKAFRPLLDKYKDFETNPGAEELTKTINRLRANNSHYYFIFLDEIIIGGVRIIEREKLCELKQLFILPEFQNKGYAKQAIYQVESLYSQKIWELDTIKQEEKLCHLYEAVGYKLTGKEEHIKPGMTLVFYRKTLPACQTP